MRTGERPLAPVEIAVLIAGAIVAAIFAAAGADALIRGVHYDSHLLRFGGVILLLAALLSASMTATAQIWKTERSSVVYANTKVSYVRSEPDASAGRAIHFAAVNGKDRMLHPVPQVDLVLHSDEDQNKYITVIRETQVKSLLWFEVSRRTVYRCTVSIPTSMGSIFPDAMSNVNIT